MSKIAKAHVDLIWASATHDVPAYKAAFNEMKRLVRRYPACRTYAMRWVVSPVSPAKFARRVRRMEATGRWS